MTRILVLSLESAADRRAATRAELDRHGLPFRFFDAPVAGAIDPAELTARYDAGANDARYKAPLSGGEIACYLGHIAMWQEVAEGQDPVLILEDDCTFLRDPAPVLAAADGHDLSGCMVKLEGEPPADAEEVAAFGDGFLCRTNRLPPRTTGYLIGPDAARAMLAARPRFFRPVDMDLKHYWEHGVPVLTLRPQLVAERPHTVSSITPARAAGKARAPLSRFFRNLAYQRAFRRGMRAHDNAAGVVPAPRTRIAQATE